MNPNYIGEYPPLDPKDGETWYQPQSQGLWEYHGVWRRVLLAYPEAGTETELKFTETRASRTEDPGRDSDENVQEKVDVFEKELKRLKLKANVKVDLNQVLDADVERFMWHAQSLGYALLNRGTQGPPDYSMFDGKL